MKQTWMTGIILMFILGLLGVVVYESKLTSSVSPNTADVVDERRSGNVDVPILYYGNICPHCHDTIEWLEDKGITHVIMKEVYDNRQNSQELTRAAVSCGLPTNNIGVPFLFAEGKCLVGTPDITNYFTQKLVEPADEPTATSSVERSNND